MTTEPTARDFLVGIMALAGGPPAGIPAAVDHILDNLAAAGFEVVALPEPEEDDTAIFAIGVGTAYVESGSRGIDATLSGTRDLITATHARSLAAALLAAANHQESL